MATIKFDVVSQGPIYNNVHPVARPTSPYPSQYQQQQQQHPQTHYQQQPSAHYNPQQHQQREPPQQHSCVPIQYTQAQFNTQPSRDFSASPTFAHEPHYAPQQQQHLPNTTTTITTSTHPSYEYDRQQPPSSSTLTIDTPCATAGWRPICPPVAKPTGYVLNQYQHQHQQPPPPPPPSSEAAFGSCVNTEHDYAPLTLHHQQQPQQPQQEQLQQPTYRANSYDHYQPPTVQQQQHQQAPSPQKYQAVSNPAQYNHQPQQQPQQPYQYRAQSQQQQSAVPRQQQPNWSAQSQQQQPAYHAQSNQYPSQQPQPPYQFESHSPQYNSYSQPQTQQQQHPYPEDYRGGSPGIITLRKEAPVSQKAAPVFTSQPAAVNYKGGNNMRGDLKWPPPEYKEQAARENEERRQLALGPVCRPRKIKRDYTEFFAKNQLNSYYPGYKVPPGTQHMV